MVTVQIIVPSPGRAASSRDGKCHDRRRPSWTNVHDHSYEATKGLTPSCATANSCFHTASCARASRWPTGPAPRTS
eukprot:3398132-Heterocapsa_arctica.AAC.1